MKYEMVLILIALPVALVGTCDLGGGTTEVSAEPPEPEAGASEHVELGDVEWYRDFEKARKAARESGQPLFVLFTEVPGCATVRGYGRRVLSNDSVVDAIEAEFVPVAIFNNVEGDDREVLNSFDEPTWNNPAVRIIEPDRTALAPRLYGDYSVHATLETMVSALESAEGTVPSYLKVLERQHAAAGRTETGVFGMYCFWTGEARLGRLPGVVETRPGFLEGTEVVEVTYDPKRVDLRELAKRAKSADAASSFYARTEAVADAVRPIFGEATHRTDGAFRYAEGDDNYALRDTAYRDLEMSSLQTTLVNSAVAAGEDPDRFLTPDQRRRVE